MCKYCGYSTQLGYPGAVHIDCSEKRVAILEAALRPFADAAESYKNDPAAFVIASNGGTIVSVYNLRDAASVLAGFPNNPD